MPSAANIADPLSRGVLVGFNNDLRLDLDVDSALDELLIQKHSFRNHVRLHQNEVWTSVDVTDDV